MMRKYKNQRKLAERTDLKKIVMIVMIQKKKKKTRIQRRTKSKKNLVKNKQFQRRSQPKFKKKKILTILNLK